MNVVTCTEERAVIEAIGAGLWPDHAPAELRAHVDSCATCREVADVALMLAEARDDGWRDAEVPGSGLVWWRAEMRARADAARVASRPMTVVYGVALLCGVGALAAGVSVWAGKAETFLRWFTSLAPADGWSVAASSQMTSLAQHGALVAVVAGLLLVAPVAVYFATSEK